MMCVENDGGGKMMGTGKMSDVPDICDVALVMCIIKVYPCGVKDRYSHYAVQN